MVQFKAWQCKLPSRKAEPIIFREAIQIETKATKQPDIRPRSGQESFNVLSQSAEIGARITGHYQGHSRHGHAIVRMAPAPIHAIGVILG